MKRLYLKRTVFIMLCLLASLSGFAQQGPYPEPAVGDQMLISGIAYKVTSTNPLTVKVVRKGIGIPYSGKINIPSKVTNGSWTYNVTAIGADAFSNRDTLDVISIPSSIVEIEQYAFGYHVAAKRLIIEDGEENLIVHNYSFWTLSVLEKETYIGRSLIYDSSNGGSNSCFANSSLGHVVIGSHVKTLDNHVFSGAGITSIELPNGLETIGRRAFENCYFSIISIPPSVKEISQFAFSGCNYLKDVIFEDGETDLVVENNFDSFNGYTTFSNCPIDSIYLGRNLRIIEHSNQPFLSASLTKLTIGSIVSNGWDSKTFQNCTRLTHIYPLWENPISITKNVFPDAVYANATLLVPGGTVKKYQATEAWKYFSNIVPTSIGVTMTATEGGSIRLGDEIVSGGMKLLQVKPNSLLTFEIVAEDEYYLESVVMNEVDVTSQIVDGKFTPTDLSEDIELTATFKAKPYYTVTATASEGGTAVVESESVMMGRSTTIAFTADEGHELVSVTVNGEDKTSEVTDGVLTLSDIKEDKTIVATFQKFRYAITAAQCENGSISLSTSEAEWGDDVTITLVPDPHYEAATVSVNGEDMTAELTDNQLTIQDVREALTIDATFCLQTFAVSATCNEGGSVSLSGETAQWGTSVTITIEPDDEHFLESITVNGTDVTSDAAEGYYTIASVECDTEIFVTFVAKPYFNVTATVSSGGTALVENNSVMWGCGTTVIFTADEGYELASVTVNGVNKTIEVVDGVMTLTDIIENTVIVATFQKLRFMITVAECEGGNISLSASEVEWGDNVTVTIAADEDYKLASLIVAGEDVTVAVEDNQYVIRSIKNNIEVSATFSSTVAFIHLSTDGESTYCSDHDLDFSQTNDIKAYIASGYYPETGNVLLTRVYEVPAGTGIVVKGSAGTHKVPFGKSSAYYLNLLAGNVDPITIEPTEEEYVNLYLTPGDDGLGFYRVTTPLEMEANSAYLQLPANLVSSGRRSIKIVYEDDSDIILMGDVNSDNEVDLSDAIMVTYYSLHVVPASFNEAAADMNGDGQIDLSDAIIIIYKSLGVK